MANFRVSKVHQMQAHDPQLMKLREDVQKGLRINFGVKDDGDLVINGRLFVLDIKELKKKR